MGTTSDLAKLVRVYWSLLLGNVLEWYEFAVYGYLEGYMQDNFFHGSAISTWLGFAATFLARPLGGFFLGMVGDVLGRKASVMISIVGMLVGTVGQGLLPTYLGGSKVWGDVGLCLLVMFRFLQGLCTGGEISAVATYITEVGPPKALGRSIALISITANIGFLSAQAMVYALKTWLGHEQMMQWGWRIPFVFALLPGLISVAGRTALPESAAFSEGHEKAGTGRSAISTAKYLMRTHFYAVLLGIAGIASYTVLQWGGIVWGNSFLAARGTPAGVLVLSGVTTRLVQLLLAFPVGWLADVRGVGWVTCVGAAVIAVAGLPMFMTLQSMPTNPTAVFLSMGLGYGLMGAISGTVLFLYVVELFPTSVRNLGVGISYNLSVCIFGGFTPVITQAALKCSSYAPGCILAAGGLITLLSTLWGLRLQRQGHLRLAHVRPEPYFGTWSSGQPQNAVPDGPDVDLADGTKVGTEEDNALQLSLEANADPRLREMAQPASAPHRAEVGSEEPRITVEV